MAYVQLAKISVWGAEELCIVYIYMYMYFKSYLKKKCFFKNIRNPCLDICKLSATWRVFLTLKYGLHKHPALLCGVTVSIQVCQAGLWEHLS